jgi:hypothetical protein
VSTRLATNAGPNVRVPEPEPEPKPEPKPSAAFKTLREPLLREDEGALVDLEAFVIEVHAHTSARTLRRLRARQGARARLQVRSSWI